jgi:two-component system CheB/CheR fusion protein
MSHSKSKTAKPPRAASPSRKARSKPPAPVLEKPRVELVPADEEERVARDPRCTVVGIGASAGGLEALEVFLRHVPATSGLAWVVIQHLDPSHEAMLVPLLQRNTKLKVEEVKDGTEILPDHVYVIPRGQDMSVLQGRLQLLPPATTRGLHLPIDFFFRTLAADLSERAIGVVLSGMGSDGTLGLRAIKEKAGAVFVQSLTSAKFDGMPRSAIESGLADVVAPAEELPGRIIAYRKHAPHLLEPPDDKAKGIFESVIVLLRAQTGNDFSLYKRSTIYRRIERRMGLHQISNPSHYVRLLRDNPQEIDLLFKELLIGVTSFFRDAAAWEILQTRIMPDLLTNHGSGSPLRAWVAGCSTGEEAYSLAIVFKEVLETLRPPKNITLQIFATDLDRDAIDRARSGHFPDNIVADVSPERLRRFFVHDDRGYRVSKDIREMIVFAPQNLAMDPPFTRLDIVTCRNLLIYLSSDLQKRLIPLFHYTLTPNGVLFLGSAETVGPFTNLFAALDSKTRFYRRLGPSTLPAVQQISFATRLPRFESQNDPEEEESPIVTRASTNIQTLTDRVIVQKFSPLGILCNEQGDVLYVSSRAGKYFEPAVGKANLNVFAMAREGLRYELSKAFAAALRDDQEKVVRRIKLGTNGGTQIVTLTVQRLKQPKELSGSVIVVLSEAEATTRPPKVVAVSEPKRVSELRAELERAQEDIQTTREEMQTSQEELKSTNEELQSTNEELQSTNEELTTSKEEMQSLNEELQTVNHELQAKVDELSRSNNDMKNLLNSTDIATLFLDGRLRVRRFTTPTARIINLIPSDVGRPVTDIVSNLIYDQLAADAAEVLRTLVSSEKQAATKDGRWFLVRIMPYRTLENMIDGVVITFTDASASRALEAALQDQTNQVRQMAESLPTLIMAYRPDGSADFVSQQWVDYTGMSPPEQVGYGWFEQVHPDDRERVREEWRASLRLGQALSSEMRLRGRDGLYRWFRWNCVPIRDGTGQVIRWYGTTTDIDEGKRAERELDAERTRIVAILDEVDKGVVVADGRRSITRINRAATAVLGAKVVPGKLLTDAFPKGAGLDDKIDQAVESGRPVSFDASIAGNALRVRIVPVRDGEVTLFLEAPRSPA